MIDGLSHLVEHQISSHHVAASERVVEVDGRPLMHKQRHQHTVGSRSVRQSKVKSHVRGSNAVYSAECRDNGTRTSIQFILKLG